MSLNVDFHGELSLIKWMNGFRTGHLVKRIWRESVKMMMYKYLNRMRGVVNPFF